MSFQLGIFNTYTPVVTLVGGAGNTVPVYATNIGRWTKIGNMVWLQLYFTGDGGAEGAGTGVLNFSLPITSAATQPVFRVMAGYMYNATATASVAYADLNAGATSVTIRRATDPSAVPASANGNNQSNTAREIRFNLVYEV